MTALERLATCVVTTPGPRATDITAALRPVVDTLAVATAGRHAPVTTAVRAEVAHLATESGATDWGTGLRLPSADAAYVNGVASHALDFDDVSMAMSGHPSALLVPVVLATAEQEGASVGEMLAAYAVGLHVDIAISAGFDLIAHYNRGWHASVTIGTMGATAAAARLARLSEEQVRHALGIAVSMAAGTRQNFGTMTKPLHIGLAAHNALRAVRLAALGVDSAADALEGPIGFYPLHSDEPGDPAAVEAALERPVSDALATLSTKGYPCCYQTHRAIDAALDLRHVLGAGALGDIERVVVHVNPGSDTSLIHTYATTPTQARFCLRFAVATTLLSGAPDFATFAEEAVAAAPVQELMRRIEVVHSDEIPFETQEYEADYATVLVQPRGGDMAHVTCTAPRGNCARPLTDGEFETKIDACLAEGGLNQGAARLLGALRDPDAPAYGVLGALRTLDTSGTPMREGNA